MKKNKRENVVAIIQARMGADRLPGKPLKEVLGKPLLGYQLERLKRARSLNLIVVATTTNPRDQQIVEFCQKESTPFFRGSEEDVLDRYYHAAQKFSADIVVRLTADCPLIDPQLVDDAVSFYIAHYPQYDYVANTLERTYPRGMDVEVFSFKSLKEAAEEASYPAEREHVTPFIIGHPERYKQGKLKGKKNESHHRWTVDMPEDFELISLIIKSLWPQKPNFTLDDVLKKFEEHPEWIKINAHIQQKHVEYGHDRRSK